MIRQRSARDDERLSEIIGRADEKINDLQSAIDTFIAKNAEAIRGNKNLKVPDEDGLNTRIDEIITNIWDALDLIRSYLPRIADGSTCEPHIWCRDLPTPAVNYGPEEKSTLPIINALDPHLSKHSALAAPLRNLLTITGDKNRELRVFQDVRVAGFRQINSKPDTISGFTVGFVPQEYTEIQTAFVERAKVAFSHSNAVVPYLGDILEVIETIISKI